MRFQFKYQYPSTYIGALWLFSTFQFPAIVTTCLFAWLVVQVLSETAAMLSRTNLKGVSEFLYYLTMPYTALWLLTPGNYGAWVYLSLNSLFSNLLCDRQKYLQALKLSRSREKLIALRYGKNSLAGAIELMNQSYILSNYGIGDDGVWAAERALHMLESSKIGSNVKDEYRPWLLFMSAIAHSAADDIPTALTQADQVLELIESSALTGGIEMRAVSLCNKGYFLLEANRHKEAEDYLRRALEMLPPSTPALLKATVLNNLGEALRQQGKLSEAEEHLVTALETREKYLPEKHPHRAYCYHNIANLCKDKSMLVEAGEYFEAAMEIRTIYPGIRQRELLATVTDYSEVLFALGRNEEAEALLEVHRNVDETPKLPDQ